MSQPKVNDSNKDVLEWIRLREEIGGTADELYTETGKEKLIRKIKENPLVPIGALATTGCLSYGIYNFRKGDKRMSQLMMRARVAAQGFTVAALVGGIWFAAKKADVVKKND